MSEMDYHVIALVPSDAFDPDSVMKALADAGYNPQLEMKNGEVGGIRVVEDDGWGIVAWVEDDEEAIDLIDTLKEEPPPGASAAQLEGCRLILSIWSDDDAELMNAHVFEEFIQCLKNSLGYFIYDNRLGEWR